MDQQLKAAQQEQLNVFAPQSYTKAAKALEATRKAQEKDQGRKYIITNLSEARAYTDMVYQRGERVKKDLHDVADARANAIQAGSMYLAKDELAELDKEFKDYTENLESDPTREGRPRDVAKLQTAYIDLELRTIKKDKLNTAYNYIQSAKDADARKYAPESLVKAEEKVFTAEKAIESDRHDELSYGPAVNAAIDGARETMKIALTAKNAKKMTPEQIAMEISAQEKMMAKADASARALRERTTMQGAYIQEITEANRELAGDVSFETKLKDMENRFSKNEAEVYRQGDNVVVRLKSIQFPSARSELPQTSLPTLAKVSEIIKELDAQTVTVEGHTDSVGDKGTNLSLSQKRAEAVSEYFVAQNSVDAGKVKSVGRGYQQPITDNKSKEGRAQNRRVDVIIKPQKL
jgi:outer membrane protein OmpA-like peptidoglycan-associated protein